MRILVTNDDGIDSPGIWALAEVMSRLGETMVVAPDTQRSGAGTSVSLRDDVNIVEVSSPVQGVSAYAISGTPSDCVITGLRRLAKDRIGLIVSGINLGANLGNDIPYSGTVMATLQGYFRKIPSLAISLVLRGREEEPRFDVAARVAELLTLGMQDGKIPTEAIINANIPNIPLEQVKGLVTTRTAPSGYLGLLAFRGRGSQDVSSAVIPPTPTDYRHQVANIPGIEEGTDIWAIINGFISVTPLRLDVTDHNLIPSLDECMSILGDDLLGKALDNED